MAVCYRGGCYCTDKFSGSKLQRWVLLSRQLIMAVSYRGGCYCANKLKWQEAIEVGVTVSAS